MNVKQLTRNVTLALILGAMPLIAQAAAEIIVVNADEPGEGFNDPTPVQPIGGNNGLTLGQQRLNAFQYAANIWGRQLDSAVPIRIKSNFDPLACEKDSATLGSAGPLMVNRDFAGAPRTNTWYHGALANKLLEADDFEGEPVIRARFNSNLGKENCLEGGGFYLGLDGQHGHLTDLVGVLLHEFGHGLGFSNLTNGQTGRRYNGIPSMWDYHLYDLTAQKSWVEMTDAERVASGVNSRKLIWRGQNVTQAAPRVLQGAPELRISGLASVIGTYQIGTASFGPQITAAGTSAEVMPVVDQTDGRGLACDPLTANNASAIRGKIALVDRGTCSFNIKVKNAQLAGAVGVLVADNAAGSPPPGLGGSDPTVTIPAVRITKDDGEKLKLALKQRSRNRSGIYAALGISATQRAGSDEAGRLLMFAPNPYQPGSSVSHFDTSASPDLLMEPFNTESVKRNLDAPHDLTFPLLRDLGW
ncbi:PA domain-containing protein [Chitinivorax sp. B]|uniref:PA domain-containing protein n=1 Tax=Chitinivorax sp. B TaxID=2502235 RepID=UPI0010F8D01A|nr:PA domain-containing protein [Chitinivorax sp. B]